MRYKRDQLLAVSFLKGLSISVRHHSLGLHLQKEKEIVDGVEVK